ncbi:MAG: PAS domain S-box protein [Hydrogenophaga sp.]|uniref:hybrid sensor histidine kinase/response regulator n=1 Tax=Hydrogenophaga sp. TaxID=1904254 RepID=UPI001D3BE506|nr:ATP-binding protein [Hydrogenophaga sp.]MBX3609503.1 PAS domain S-box protein [Hydrogenophaga sp.]
MPTADLCRDDWGLMPGVAALLSRTGEPIAVSALWQSRMASVVGAGDWRDALDDDGRLGLLDALARRSHFTLKLNTTHRGSSVVHWQCQAWWDPHAQAHACFFADVTASEVGRIAHLEDSQRIEWMFERLPVEVAFYSFEPELMCLYANERYAKSIGRTLANTLGKSAYELLTSQERQHIAAHRPSSLREGESMTFDMQRRDPDGQTRDLEVTITCHREARQLLNGYLVLLTDVSERRKTEASMRASQARLFRFMEASAEGVVFHREGVITDVNPAACRLFGQAHAELVGTSILRLPPQSLHSRTSLSIFSGADAFRESEIVDAQGRHLPVELIGRTLDRHGERLRMTVIRDIQDRRQAQTRIHALIDDLRSQKERAEAADRAKSMFLAAASHDLRQPIHALGLFLTALRAMAQSTVVPSEELGQICKRMQTSLDGLGQLLNMLLDVSRLDANAIEVRLAPTSLTQLFGEIEQEFADIALERGLALDVAYTNGWVLTDATVLRRILSNLMANAIRYTPRGRVLLGSRSRGDHIEIQVHDSGIGISPEQLDAIFEEFYQVDVSASQGNESHGLGLGLSIVKRSARLLNAQIQVRSTPGRGSMFSIMVPACEPAQALPEHGHDDSASDPGRRCVLVIDDDEQVLMGMQQLLQIWGHTVWCAATADEAVVLAIAHAAEIDLLLSDYRLGGNTTAVQAIAAIHACLGRPVPTYILTGDTSPQRIQEASELGFPLLHKPVDVNALRSALEH